MKKIISVMFILAIISLFSKEYKMAILNFSVNDSGTEMDYLSSGISDILITNLAEKHNVTIIEREKIQNIIDELNFKNSGLVTEKEQTKIGELSGADYIVTGSITFVNSAYRLVSKVMAVETGNIISTQSVKGKNKNSIFDSADNLSSKIYSDILGSTNIPGSGPELEVAFIIDTTGSMGDEINVVKEKIIMMIDDILQGDPKPVVKFAVVDYKDRSDPYVTKIYDFKSDIREIKNDINRLSASGGGDFPESVKEALYMGVNKLNWSRSNTKIGKLCFLIGDAEPHMDYKGDYKFKDIIKSAKDISLSISSISCSGNSSKGVEYFQDIANETNGTFSYLTYTQEVVDDSGKEFVVVTEGDHEVVVDEIEMESVTEVGESAGDFFLKERAKKKAERARSETRSLEQAKEDADEFMATAPSVSKDKARKIKSSGKVKGEKKNNLDKIMSEQIKVLAEKQGIKYEKPKPKKKVIDKTKTIKKKISVAKEEVKEDSTKVDEKKEEVKKEVRTR